MYSDWYRRNFKHLSILILGSVFLVEADTAFDIAKFVHTLANEGDQIDVYYSVMNVEPKTYQITMTDKGEFKGDSILPAQKFYAEVKTGTCISWM